MIREAREQAVKPGLVERLVCATKGARGWFLPGY